MTCKPDSTHFACDCVLEQLRLADELANELKILINMRKKRSSGYHIDGFAMACVEETLAAYEKVRKQ